VTELINRIRVYI